MGFITMWSNGARRCVLAIGGEQPILRLVDATSVIREQVVRSDAVALLADQWEREEEHAPLWVMESVRLLSPSTPPEPVQ
jgi:hypothetical protein